MRLSGEVNRNYNKELKTMSNKEETKPKTESDLKRLLCGLFRKKEPSQTDRLIAMFLGGEGYKKLAEEQGRAMQEHYYRLKEIERQKMIKEKYSYLKYRIENNLTVNEEEQKEFDYVKFLIEQK